MMLPLALLTIGALCAGYINWPSDQLGQFLGHSPSLSASYELASGIYGSDDKNTAVTAEGMGQPEPAGSESKPSSFPVSPLMMLSGLISIAGISLAYLFHLADRARGERVAEAFGPITRLLENKYWVDEIYQSVIVDNLFGLGVFLFAIDQYIVDGIVNAVGIVPQLGGFSMKLTTQRGYLQGYAVAMLLGIAAILLLMFV
jgi:NADH:ubiquinone oxidoreductase subunit 5 (subunit L)/multisubunit Na+/H+ antiporter MnhA subunit